MIDERFYSAFELEDVALADTFVPQLYLDAAIEQRKFAQTLGEDVVMKLDIRKHFGAWQETDGCSALLRGLESAQRIKRLTEMVFLLVLMTVAVDGQPQVIRQCVDHRYAHAVQSAGNLVGVVVELSAGMKDRHHHFGR